MVFGIVVAPPPSNRIFSVLCMSPNKKFVLFSEHTCILCWVSVFKDKFLAHLNKLLEGKVSATN